MNRNITRQKISFTIISIVALALLMLPLLVQPIRQVIFLTKSGEIRRMKPDSSKLERMVFTAGEFAALKFVRQNREFVYHGNQYDVHSITRSGSVVVVVALWDTMETRLLIAMAPHDKQNDVTSPDSTKFGFMPYFSIDTFRVSFCQPRPLLSYRLFCLKVFNSLSLPVFTPPPELLIHS